MKIIQRSLPHSISYADVRDPIVRQKIMMLVENERSLKEQLAEMQKVVSEMQKF